jgi:chemotaxis protein methyltransferase CheR
MVRGSRHPGGGKVKAKSHFQSNHSRDLINLRDLVEEKTGLYLPAEKLDRLEEPFKDSKGNFALPSPGEVLRSIASSSECGRAYLTRLVTAITTHETYFFRTPPHFNALKNYLIPEILHSKRYRGEKTLRFWSAGCSTGEEPYSLAMLLLDIFPDIGFWQVNILATDIDLDALERAEKGIYGRWSFRGVAPEITEKHFHRISEERYRVDDRIRSMVTFQPLNLKSDPYPSSFFGTTDLDIILCRNVTIYFRPETTQKIIHNFCHCLNEGGFLLTGTAEHSFHAYKDFEVRVFPETIIYQRPPSEREVSPPPKPISIPLPPLELTRPPAKETRHKPAARKKKPEKHPMEKSLDLLAQGEVDKTLMLLAEEVEKNPKDSRACFLLGRISADRNHQREAIYWLSQTVALDPLHWWAHYLLGLLRLEENRIDQALQSLKKAVYIEPDFALGHFYLGRAHKHLGQTEKARKNFTTVKKLLDSLPLSQELEGAESMTTHQLLTLVDKELDL